MKNSSGLLGVLAILCSMAQGQQKTVTTKGGTLNFVPKFSGSTMLTNSAIFETGGRVGIGTTSPTTKLTVNGIVNSTSGGFKFPDGSIMTTAHGMNGLTKVFHDTSLTGMGTNASPLGIATPLILNVPASTSVLTLTNQSLGSHGLMVTGGPNATAAIFNGGPGTTTYDGGDGADIYGGSGSSGGTSIYAIGGSGSVYSGGYGIVAYAGLEPNFTRIHAAYFGGDVTVSGSLSKAGGSFKIDHPLDPANKYLYHSFVESPDMMNVYNGNVVTDLRGFATVTMPEWFEALNGDFRYQLTVIGQFAQAMVASEIANNQFTIQTDKPNVKVSWQVTGIRQDAWANAHRIPVEEEKTGVTRDHYLHPELYNQPPEKSVDWAERPEMMRAMARQAKQ
jgi:hypothetical protein